MCIIVPKFATISRTDPEIWPIFHFLRWRPPPSWILEISNFNGWDAQKGRTAKSEILTVRTLLRAKVRHRAKFREDRSNRSGDMAYFRFFKMAAAAILDLAISNF